MKKRRGYGNKGGRGNAGSGKRADSKKMSMRNAGRVMGKFGFVSRIFHENTCFNISWLDEHLERLVEQKRVVKEKDAYAVDAEKLGYTKLLGAGQPKHKYHVTVAYCSAKAKDRIESSGGTVILTGKRQEKQPEKKEQPVTE